MAHRTSRRARQLPGGLLALGLVAASTPLALTGAPASATPPVLRGAPAAATSMTMAVFDVRSTGLTGRQAARLGKALGIRRLARAGDGSVRFAAQDGFLAVPTKTAGRGEDEDGNPTTTSVLDQAALKRIRTLPARRALDRVRRALASTRLSPAGGRAVAGATTLKTVDGQGQPTADVALDTTVSYTFTLAGVPYEGPGAKVRVAFDGRGAVTNLAYSTRTLARGEFVPVLDAEAAARRCGAALGDGVRVSAAVPAYHAPALTVRATRIEPSFRCSGVTADGTPTQVVFVPAAVDAVLPEMPPPPPPREPSTGPSTGAPHSRASQAFGVADVGSEGTGPCSGLPHTGANLASFNNRFAAAGVGVEFSWRDQNAWEQDFKDPALGGDDSDWTDHVDMTYWQGHGAPTGFSFAGCSSNDDTFLANTDARWGNGDVEWMSLFTCQILQQEAGGQRWWQRWGPAFAGLHQINSFHTVSYHSASHGGTFANYLLRRPFLGWNKPMPVRSAWAQASIDDQPPSVVWASMGPIGAGGAVNLDDYFWGKGAVGPDVPAAAVTGWWYLSGMS